MGESSLNKLIIIFLALAIIAGTSVFIFNSGDKSAISSRSSGTERTAEEKAAKIPQNSFVEPLPQEENKTANTNKSGGNLTEALAAELSQQILETNPDGPDMIDGELGITAPDPNEIIEKALASPETYAALYKKEAELIAQRTDPKKVKILEEASQEEILTYLKELKEIVEDDLLVDTVAKLPEQQEASQAISFLETTIQSATIKLDKLQVPRQFLKLHISMRDTLIGMSAMISAEAKSNDDPMLSLIVIQKEADALEKSLYQLRKEAAQLPKNVSGIIPPNNLSWWQTILAKRAMAIVAVPVADILNTALQASTKISTWAQLGLELKNWAQNILLEVVKTHLIKRITQLALSWIKGNGTPRFVTNWRLFLDKTFNEAAGEMINKLAPQLCSPFGPLIKISLKSLEFPEQGVSCTLDKVIANITNFYNDFRNGGWISYTTMLQPQNNLIGAFMITSDLVDTYASRAKEAAQNEALAGKGYLGQKKCVKWEGNNCAEYEITTPGSTVGETLNAALLAPISRIVNAQSLNTLVTMLIDSALNKLLSATANKDGEEGLLGLNEGTSTFDIKLCDTISEEAAYKECVAQAKASCAELPEDLQQQCLEGIVPTFNPASTTCSFTDPLIPDAKLLPDQSEIVRQVANEFPAYVQAACSNSQEKLKFVDEVVSRLYSLDSRFGYNGGKNREEFNVSPDTISYYYNSDNPKYFSADVYVVKILDCGQENAPTWSSLSCFDDPFTTRSTLTITGSYIYPRPLLAELQSERAKYGTKISDQEAGEILNKVAWDNRNNGWGLASSFLPEGEPLRQFVDCPFPGSNKSISCSLLLNKRTNTTVRVFDPKDGEYIPQWSVLNIYSNPAAWIEPVEP